MSVSGLIIVQLGFFLVVSWFFAVVVIRKLRNTNDEQADLIKELKRTRPKSINSSINADESASIGQVDDPSSDPDNDITSILGSLDSDFESNSQSVSELDGMLQAQSESILRLRNMREAMEGKKNSVDGSALNREITTLKEKNENSEAIIIGLKARLDSSRSRMKTVEKRMVSLEAGTGLEADTGLVASLEAENRRLSMSKSKLEQKIKKEMCNHQQAVDRIQTQLKIAEERSKEKISKAKIREQTLLNTIVELQEKLQADVIGEKTEEELNILKNELTEAQDALNRAVSEKEFLESNYLDLEQAFQESANAKEELERTRIEYQMLESHFLAQGQESEEFNEHNNGEIDVPEHRKNLDTLNPVEVASESKPNVLQE